MDRDRLEFDVLGPLRLRRGGAAVPITSRRQRLPLAALLVGDVGPAPAGRLIDAVWEESLPADPRSALNTLLSRLRAALGRDALVRAPTGYRLDRDDDAVDADRFETLSRSAVDLPPAEAITVLDEALSLWRGPAYAEFEGREFAVAEAVRLNEQRSACIEERARLLLQVGEFEAAVAGLEAHVATHPLSERALGLLMTALYRLGRHGEALRRVRDHRRMLVEEMGLDPSPALAELEQRILNHDLSEPVAERAATPRAPRWPASDDLFLGREHEMTTLADLAEDHRLVTVTGMAGVGKTRLVAESLRGVVDRVGLAATVVELARVDPGRFDVAIASTLGIGPTSGDTAEATLEYLSVTPTLLVLDNCEHVIDQLDGFLATAFGRCPGLRVLATSRRPIGLRAEQVVPLDPLEAPAPDDPPEAAEPTPAMRLFVARIHRLRPSHALTAQETLAAAAICRRLDGLPLAIELAAARAASLGVQAVATRLGEGLDLLGRVDAHDRRSLRDALDWSHGLLARAEQLLLAALSVFEGPFDLEAAEWIAADLIDEPVAVCLAGLVDASLVATADTGGGARYRLLETVRQFARDRLAASDQEGVVCLAHAQLVRSRLHRAVEGSLGSDDAVVAARIETESPDIRGAISWALRVGETELAAEMTGALALATSHWHLSSELVDLVHRVADAPGLDGTAAGPLAWAGSGLVATFQGDLEAGERAAGHALEKARTDDERWLALFALGIVTLYLGRHDESRRWWNQLLAIDGLAPAHRFDGHASLALIATYAGDDRQAGRHLARAQAAAEASGSHAHRCFVQYVEAELVASQDLEAAVPMLAAASRQAVRIDATFRGGLALMVLSAAHTRLGHTAEAAEDFAHLLDLWLRQAAWPQMWTTLRLLAELLSSNRRPQPAALLLLAANLAVDAPAVAGDDVPRYGRLESQLRERIDPDAWERISALATMLTRTQVVDRAHAAVRDLAADTT